MKNLVLILFTILFLASCDSNESNSAENQNIKKEILKKEFTNQEVLSIEIVEIKHPMLGGVISIDTLDETQKNKFLSDFNKLKRKGIYKCKSSHVVRINFESETLRLKVCGGMISSRTSDIYYELPSQSSIIKEYISNDNAEIKEEKLKVLVLPPYDEISNRGISPDIRKQLENELIKSNKIELIPFPFKQLLDVPYQNVFDKKYCKQIIENVDCDIIVMSKLNFIKETGFMPRDGWSLRIRLYNANSDIQINSELKIDSLSPPGIKKVLGLTQEIIINEIESTVTNTQVNKAN